MMLKVDTTSNEELYLLQKMLVVEGHPKAKRL
jgi:hypothetical protein